MDDNIEIDEGSRWKNMPSSALAWKVAVLQTQVETGRILRDDELRRIDAGSIELCRRFCASKSPGDIDDVETAISWQTLALQFTDERNILRRSRLAALGVQFALRFGSSSDLSDLDEATTWLRCAIELRADDAIAAACLTRLGLILWTRFVRSGESRDLEGAVLSLAQATHAIVLASADIMSDFASFFTRFEAVRQSGRLTQFVAAFQRTEAGDRGAEPTARYLTDLNDILLRPVPTDAVEAIKLLPDVYHFIAEICDYLSQLSQSLAAIDDVNGALAAAKLAVEITPDEPIWHDFRTTAVRDLISALSVYLDRHTHKSLDDVCAAINHLDRAFEFVMDAHVHNVNSARSFVVHACLIVDRGLRWLPDGDMLTKCRQIVSRIHHALNQLPAEDIDGDRLQTMDLVCNSYMLIHERFHDADALDAAIDALRQRVHLYDAASVSRVGRYRPVLFLAHLLQDRFYLSRVDADVQEAVERLTHALSLASTADDEEGVAGMSHMLAILSDVSPNAPDSDSAERRVRAELSPEDLALYSSQAHQQGDADTPTAKRALAYFALAKHSAALYDRTARPSDREEAVAAYRNAINNARTDIDRLRMIEDLIVKLMRWNSVGLRHHIVRPEVILELLELNDEQLKCGGSSFIKFLALTRRVDLCGLWFDSVERFGEPTAIGSRSFDADEEILRTCQQVMDIAPSMISQGYSIPRRYTEIARIGDFVRHAVGRAALKENPIALKWFEEGRAFVWGQILSVRTFVDDKRVRGMTARVTDNGDTATQRQELARELRRVSEALESTSGAGDAITALSFERERLDLLHRIRSLDGLEGFLKPKGVDELVDACRSSAVVCLTEFAHVVYALIPRITTRPDEETVTFLPFLLHENANTEVWRRRLNSSLGLQPVRRSRPAVINEDSGEKHRVLRELWYFLVQPILESLNIRTDVFPADGVDLQVPRITWCTTGALSFLPLHAAGPYDPRSPNAFDLVVSSYTPNLASILPSRLGVQAAKPNILVVAQPDIAGFSPLPGTRKEADVIQSLFPKESCVRLDGSEGTVEGVFDKLRTHNYVHLACHGEQDSEDPLKSSFILHDGRPLTLEKLMEIAHSSDFVGELAFLSACETATGDEKVPDEAVHLAAGMMAAGYRSVVATMWSIGDNHAPRVADLFYKTLLAQHDKDEKTEVARALHAAVATLRKEVGVDEFAKWAPFVHYGL